MRIFIENDPARARGSGVEARQRTETLQRVAAPLLHFRAAGPGGLPARWRAGGEAKLRLFLFGVLPVGRHDILVDVARP